MVTAATAVACLLGAASPAFAQQGNGNSNAGPPAFAPGMIAHMQAMRRFKDPDHGAQPTPHIIPRFELDPDASGAIATFQPGGATFPANNAFFQDLGTNNRTCFTCHQPQTGWGVSAASVAQRFATSLGTDPIFRVVDGATCPSDDVSSFVAKRRAYSLLIDKGLIRIGLPVPATAQFEVTSVADPYDCNTNPVTGLTSPTAGTVSIYRRPLPSTNLGFLSTIMWDGREPSFASQATDATLGHAQAAQAPTAAQVADIVAFESGIFTAQEIDQKAGVLHGDGAMGGPVTLSLQLAAFFIGINDPLGLNPTGPAINPNIIEIYRPSLSTHGYGDDERQPASIAFAARCSTPPTSTSPGWPGSTTCSTRRASPASAAPATIRRTSAIIWSRRRSTSASPMWAPAPPVLDISGLRRCSTTCTAGPLAGQVRAK